jgi:hypothetical protein
LQRLIIAPFFIAICALVMQSNVVWASGAEWSGAEKDLQVSVDYRWAGCRIGGYFPIRIRMTNRGPTRVVTAEFDSSMTGRPMPEVTRSIEVDQNETASFSLLVPMVSTYSHGSLRFSDDSGELEGLRTSFSLPDIDFANSRPGLLVISSQLIDVASYEAAVSTRYVAVSRHGSHVANDHETIPPRFLPDTWLAYSGLDLVAIDLNSLKSVTNDNRSALVRWAHAGGTLIVSNIGPDDNAHDELDKLLELDQAADSRGWEAADLKLRNQNQPQIQQLEPGIGVELVEPDFAQNDEPMPQQLSVYRWNADSFKVRNVALGRVVAFREQPFLGTSQDWIWLFANVDPHNTQLRLGHRLGVAGRSDNKDFLQFVIPGIRSIPPIAFLIFISIFTFVIGPLNYFFLSKRRRLNLLVVTIPLIAVVTSVLLFGYSAVAHGFGIKARLRSVTFLDQGTKTAVVSTRMALYAGSAPSSGLRFLTETAVIPIWAKDSTFEYGSVDWTKEQAMRSGWLRSRTRTQFMTTTVRRERVRLTIKSDVDSAEIKNGLEWDIEALMVVDDTGKKFFGENIRAGEAGTIQLLSDESADRFRAMLQRSTPQEPEDLRDADNSQMFSGFSRRSWGYYSNQANFHASTGYNERQIAGLTNYLVDQSGDAKFAKRVYWALVKDTPAIEIGVESTEIVDEWHLVIGFY